MTDIYVDIEHSLPQKELFKFKKLSELMGKSLQETIEICMFEKRDEYIDQFENNVPEETLSKNNNNNDNRLAPQRAEEGTTSKTIFNKVS